MAKAFTISTDNNSQESVFIQGGELNRKPSALLGLTHAEIVTGREVHPCIGGKQQKRRMCAMSFDSSSVLRLVNGALRVQIGETARAGDNVK